MNATEMIRARYVAANAGKWNIYTHKFFNDCAQQLVEEGWLIEVSFRTYELVPDVFVPTMPVLVNVADADWGDMFVSPTSSEADGWRDRVSSGIKMSKLLTLGEAAHKKTAADEHAAAAAIEAPLVIAGDIVREGSSDFAEKYTVSAFDLARFKTSRQIEVKGGAYGRYWIKVGTWWQVQRNGKWVALFKE